MSKISHAAIKGSNHILGLLQSVQTGQGVSDLPHTIFPISPADANRYLSGGKFEAVSGRVLDLLIERYIHCKSDELANFYYLVVRMPNAEAL